MDAKETAVQSPRAVLERIVVHIFGGYQKGRQKNTMQSARNAAGSSRQSILEATHIDDGGQKCGCVHLGTLGEMTNECSQRRQCNRKTR